MCFCISSKPVFVYLSSKPMFLRILAPDLFFGISIPNHCFCVSQLQTCVFLYFTSKCVLLWCISTPDMFYVFQFQTCLCVAQLQTFVYLNSKPVFVYLNSKWVFVHLDFTKYVCTCGLTRSCLLTLHCLDRHSWIRHNESASAYFWSVLNKWNVNTEIFVCIIYCQQRRPAQPTVLSSCHIEDTQTPLEVYPVWSCSDYVPLVFMYLVVIRVPAENTLQDSGLCCVRVTSYLPWFCKGALGLVFFF